MPSHSSTSDISAMFAYAFDRHHLVEGERGRALREHFVELNIDWLLRRHGDAYRALVHGLRSPGRLLSIDRQVVGTESRHRTDIELEFTNGHVVVELKVGAKLEAGQLKAYTDLLASKRRSHSGSTTFRAYVIVLVRAQDKAEADKVVNAAKTRTGVEVRVKTYDQVATRDPRWEIIAQLASELTLSTAPVPGYSSVFNNVRIAEWLTGALADVSQLGDPDFRENLDASARRQLRRTRSIGRIGSKVPSFSTHRGNDSVWFQAHGTTPSKKTAINPPAAVQIIPTDLRETGEFIWLYFPKVQDWASIPTSWVPDDLRVDAASALEASWQVMDVVVRALREAGWATPSGQPPITPEGTAGILFSRNGNEVTLWFDPRRTVWRKHGPFAVVPKRELIGAPTSWRLPRSPKRQPLNDWMRWAAKEIIGAIDPQA